MIILIVIKLISSSNTLEDELKNVSLIWDNFVLASIDVDGEINVARV